MNSFVIHGEGLEKMPARNLSGRIAELDSPRGLRIVRAVFWAIAILAGFLQTWAARFSMTPDGTCYLDIASAYLRGDWHNALNSYWSPFFSWLLALALGIFHPAPYWESTLLHLVNFAGFLIALATFEFFFRSLVRHSKEFASSEDAEPALPEFAWWILGYGLFLSTSLFVQSLTATTPDVWVAAWTYLVAGLILRIRVGSGGWRLFALLGFTLALAYFTKTFYFPITFVFLLAAWMATGNLRKTAKQAALALAIFLAVAGPWIFVLSRSRHRFTFGDAGKLNFAMMFDEIPQPFFWQGEDETGAPKHPVRQLLARPRVFEFSTPIGGTYPPALDLPYWMEGVRPHFRLRGLLRVLRQSAGTFFQIYQVQLEYGVGVVALIILLLGKSGWSIPLREQFYLWVPPLVACGAYAIVHVESRLVGPFVVPLWAGVFSGLFCAAPAVPRRARLALILAMVSATGLRVAKSMTSDWATVFAKQENRDWQVAEGLRATGLHAGDKVSDISLMGEAHWARLAGLKIVAQIPLGDEMLFWTFAPETKQKVYRLLGGTGAKMLITKNPPPSAVNEGWIPLGNTSFYAYPLAVAHQ